MGKAGRICPVCQMRSARRIRISSPRGMVAAKAPAEVCRAARQHLSSGSIIIERSSTGCDAERDEKKGSAMMASFFPARVARGEAGTGVALHVKYAIRAAQRAGQRGRVHALCYKREPIRST